MRISTSTFFDSGLNGMLNQQAAMLKTQQQVSTGLRVITPSDDPVAAVQAVGYAAVDVHQHPIHRQPWRRQGSVVAGGHHAFQRHLAVAKRQYHCRGRRQFHTFK